MIFPQKKYNSGFNFFSDYVNEKKKILDKIDLNKIVTISNIIEKKIKQNKNIFVCGNGGSASVANHFLCDFNKGIKSSSKRLLKPRIISLNNSIEAITAISNDLSFNEIFSYQLENYANKDDVLITFSCSGKSKNIDKAINLAKTKKILIISFVGFLKNNTNKKIDYFLSINSKNYGICEDIFQGIMHMIAQNIRQKFSLKNL